MLSSGQDADTSLPLREVSSGGNFVSPLGIAVEADAFGGAGGVIRVDPKTGEQTKVTSGKKFGGHRRPAVVPAAQ